MAEEKNTTGTSRPGETHAQTNGSDAMEERYRYIGFEVFPKRMRDFWKSDAERATHLSHVRQTGGRFAPLSRSHSIVATESVSKVEHVILTLGSLLLLVSPFLPWFSLSRGEQKYVYSGIVLLFKAKTVLDFLALGPGLLSTSYVLLLGLMILSALTGAATLFFQYAGRHGDPDLYLRRVHRILVWHYLPIAGWVTFFALAASPTPVPFAGSLGLAQLETTLDIASLATGSTIGLWLPFAVLWVNAIKGNDL